MKKLAYLYIILAGIFWGTSGLFVNALSPYGLDSFQLTLIRAFVAVVLVGGFVIIKDRSLFKISLPELFISILSGIGIYFTAGFYFYSMKETSVATAVVLMYTSPIIVMAYSVAFLGERLSVKKVISVLLMLTGCVFVSGIYGNAKFSTIGIITGLLSSVAYSLYNIACKIQMKRKTNPLTANFYCFLAMLVTAFIMRNPVDVVMVMKSAPLYLGLMYIGMGICTCVLPYFLYSLSLKSLPVGTAASLAIVEPMSATVIGIIFLNQVPDVFSFSGIILILFSVVLLSREKE